jgi:serine/threonine protein kinase
MLELEGHAIRHYHILRRLAHGGMSDIYLGQDTHTDRAVVIKMVQNSNHEYYERFRSEAQATSTLRHDHILPAFTHGKDASWSYIVFPYIEGGTLHDRLAQGPLSLDETGVILTQLASALQFSHDHGILHRDLKPSNILLQNGEHVYLADFGLAQQIDTDDRSTVSDYLIGTPEYMAPELAEERASVRSDIYALGVILYQLLTGHVPFRGSTPIGTYLKHIREQPASPTTLNPAIPGQVAGVILRALEKRPEDRYKSADDLARAYHNALTESTSQRDTSSALLALAPHSTGQDQLAYPTRHNASKKNPPGWSLLGLIAALCFVLVPTTLGIASYQFHLFHTDPITRNVASTRLSISAPNSSNSRQANITRVITVPPQHATSIPTLRQLLPPQSDLHHAPHSRLDNQLGDDTRYRHQHRRHKH